MNVDNYFFMDNRILMGGAAAAAIATGLYIYSNLNKPSLQPNILSSDCFLGAIDVGTGSTRFLIFDSNGTQVSSYSIDLLQYFPSPDKHEQNPDQYIRASLDCIEMACQKVSIDKSQIKGIGISNQRETTIAWSKSTGRPLYNAIIWDDARTAEICNYFGTLDIDFRAKTGLPVSTYFSATKII